MKVEEIQLTKFQVKQLFEEFNPRLQADGINAKYSWFIYKNCEQLVALYNQIITELYDERREPEFPEIFTKTQQLIVEYCDKDEKGQPIKDERGNPVFTKQQDKYIEELNKLKAEHKEFYEKLDHKEEKNREIMLQTVSFMATRLELSEFPPNTKPYIIGLLGY
jgi:hypothetical protein